jgi:hypothetical protein
MLIPIELSLSLCFMREGFMCRERGLREGRSGAGKAGKNGALLRLGVAGATTAAASFLI